MVRSNPSDDLYVKIPDLLNSILFPFRRNIPVRMVLCTISGYIEISIVIIYGLAFLRKGDLDWKNIEMAWMGWYGVAVFIAQPIEFIIEGRSRVRDEHWLRKTGYWLFNIIMLFFLVVCFRFALHYTIILFK